MKRIKILSSLPSLPLAGAHGTIEMRTYSKEGCFFQIRPTLWRGLQGRSALGAHTSGRSKVRLFPHGKDQNSKCRHGCRLGPTAFVQDSAIC